MPKPKLLSDAAVKEKLKSERPDGLVILTAEEAESLAATVAHLRGQRKDEKSKAKDK